MERPLRVAVTLEQCWHAVPGGTARAALESVRALQAHSDLDLVGVSARHAGPPPPALDPDHPGRRPCPLPRLALYEAWHWLRRPPVRAGDRAGRRHPRDRDGDAAPVGPHRGHGARPGVPAGSVPVHPQGRDVLPPRHRPRPARRHPRHLPVPGDARRLRRPRLRPGPPAAGAVGDRPASGRSRRRRRRYGPGSGWPGGTCCGPARSSPARTSRCCSTPSTDSTGPMSRWCSPVPRAGTRTWASRWPASGRRVRSRRLRRPRRAARPCTRAPICSASPAARRGSGSRCSRRWPRAPRWSPPPAPRRPRWRARPACSSIRTTPMRWPMRCERLLDDDAERRRLGAAGRARALEHFSWEQTAIDVGERADRGGGVKAPKEPGPVRVGLNLLWLVPGEVGGSEEYTVRLLGRAGRPRPGRPRRHALRERTLQRRAPQTSSSGSARWWRRWRARLARCGWAPSPRGWRSAPFAIASRWSTTPAAPCP